MFDTVESGCSIVYIEGLQVMILKIDFILTNSADTDERPPYATFHLSIHCFL